jgi:hypothetical protein
MARSKTDLIASGRRYVDFLIDVIDRLAQDNGTVLAEDMKAFEVWSRQKARALEGQLLAEGATEGDVAAWREGYRDQIKLRTSPKATTV